ncbi:MAG: energy transducer TonB, partial [Bacteroidota bacterium]
TAKTKLPGMNDFILLEKEPAAVNMDEIRKLIGYPPMAKEAEIEGKVIVRVLVNKFGDYVKHAVLKDPHPILTRAVEGKINVLKTTPGVQAGQPIPVWITIPFDFKLLK